jgi:hypothetical protein
MAADACASLSGRGPACASLSGNGASCAGRHADAADDRGPNQAPRCSSVAAARACHVCARARVCVWWCIRFGVVLSIGYIYLFGCVCVCVCVCWSIGAVVSEVGVFVCALRVRRDRLLRAVPLQRPSSAVALAGACKRACKRACNAHCAPRRDRAPDRRSASTGDRRRRFSRDWSVRCTYVAARVACLIYVFISLQAL